MTKEKMKQIGFIASLALNCFLIIAIIAVAVGFGQSKRETQNAVEAMNRSVEEANEYERIISDEMIPLNKFKENVDRFGVSTEFIQQFFPDRIVYRNGAELVYAEINEALEKSDYDWANLKKNENGHFEYIEEGVSKGIIGIDVSKYQGDINWKKVKASGVEYAVIRVGYRGYGTGKIMLDEAFEANVKGALSNDIKVGVYFYSQAVTVEEAVEEAEAVIEAIKPYNITYPVVYDFEEVYDEESRTKDLTADEITDMTIAFCDRVEEAGYKPMIYANIKWFMAKLDITRLEKYDKWFAQYFRQPFYPYSFQMWQYTGKGKVDGIEGDVDLNICFKDYAKE